MVVLLNIALVQGILMSQTQLSMLKLKTTYPSLHQEVSDPAMMDVRSVTGHWQQLFLSFGNSKHKSRLRTPSPMFYHYSIIINGMWFDSTELGYFEWEGSKYFCCAFDNVPGIKLRLVLVKCNWTQGQRFLKANISTQLIELVSLFMVAVLEAIKYRLGGARYGWGRLD